MESEHLELIIADSDCEQFKMSPPPKQKKHPPLANITDRYTYQLMSSACDCHSHVQASQLSSQFQAHTQPLVHLSDQFFLKW